MRSRVQDQGEPPLRAPALPDWRTDPPVRTPQGFFSGSYNAIGGKIKGPKGEVGELSGHWHDTMELQRKSVRRSSLGLIEDNLTNESGEQPRQRETLFDARSARAVQKSVTSEDQQAPNESRRLWTRVTAAIKAKDLDAATDAKSAIEEAQRESARQREAKGETFKPRFFKPSGKGGEWRPDFRCVPASACVGGITRLTGCAGWSGSRRARRKNSSTPSGSSSTVPMPSRRKPAAAVAVPRRPPPPRR